MLKVNTKVLVSVNVPSRRIFILRTFMTPCYLISSSSLTSFKSGQRATPLQLLREPWRDTVTLRSWNLFKRNSFSMCFFFSYSTRRSPERNFFNTFWSTNHAVKNVFITNGERLDTDLSSCE